MQILNKTILITGASKGIGKATAELLADFSVNLILTYNNDSNSISETVKIIESKGSNATAINCDISSDSSVKNLKTEIEKKYKKVDIIINNAGIFDENDSPDNIEAFRNVFSVNFLGQVMVTAEISKLMKNGKIIFVTSSHGREGHGRPGAIAYSAMKAALNSYMKNLAKHYAPDILVNAVAPGKTITPMWGEMDEEFMKKEAEDHLIQRWITVEEVAHSIKFLIENDAVCGEILYVDGGMTLKTLN